VWRVLCHLIYHIIGVRCVGLDEPLFYEIGCELVFRKWIEFAIVIADIFRNKYIFIRWFDHHVTIYPINETHGLCFTNE
jgi:hypothetical protein